MCNIAAYVGKREALPILKELIRRQEGLDSGFYTGMAIHNGSLLNYRKIHGDLDALIKETDLDTLCGTAGIAHSRTPSGGDSNWAHPFTTVRDNRVKLCYIANGNLGYFNNRLEQYHKTFNYLEENGYEIPGKIKDEGYYVVLDSGEAVHISDIMCQLIYKYKCDGFSTVEAMANGYINLPSELVGLCMEEESPDKVFYSRINKPIFVGFDSDGAYVASTPAAFPKTVKDYKLLPPLTSGIIYADRVESFKYPNFEKNVRGFNKKTQENVKNIILTLTSEKACCYDDFELYLNSTRPRNEINQFPPIIYESLFLLVKDGKIKVFDSTQTRNGRVGPLKLFQKL